MPRTRSSSKCHGRADCLPAAPHQSWRSPQNARQVATPLRSGMYGFWAVLAMSGCIAGQVIKCVTRCSASSSQFRSRAPCSPAIPFDAFCCHALPDRRVIAAARPLAAALPRPASAAVRLSFPCVVDPLHLAWRLNHRYLARLRHDSPAILGEVNHVAHRFVPVRDAACDPSWAGEWRNDSFGTALSVNTDGTVLTKGAGPLSAETPLIPVGAGR